MSLFQAVILGIVQGLTEFLPVSSSGHLVLLQKVFGINEPGLTFDVALHLGTLVPVFIIFRKEIWELIKKPFQKYTYLLVVATVPAVIFTLLFGNTIEALFTSGRLLGIGFLITGVLLLYSDILPKGKKRDSDISYADATVIGLMQAVAICPAISRSGSTITAALYRGLTKENAARFSFLLSVPAILGAAVLQIKDIATSGAAEGLNYLNIGFGFVAAALTGYVAINFMLRLIKKSKLRYFSFYVFFLAALIFLDQFFLKIFFV